MKELGYPPNFWDKVYWDFLHFPKKIWGLWVHLFYGARGPPDGVYGTPGPIEGVSPQAPKFFWEVQEVLIDFTPKIRWVAQLLHRFF